MAHTLYNALPQIPHVSPTMLILITPPLLISLILLLTSLYTRFRYRLSLRTFSATSSTHPTPPPRIPYTIPFLGSALTFLAPYPYSFWNYIFSFHPHSIGVFTLLLGGRTMHVLFSPLGIQTLFRHKTLARDSFNKDIVVNGLGNSSEDADRYFGLRGGGKGPSGFSPKEFEEKFNSEWLLKAERVNELTAEFMRKFRRQIDGVLGPGEVIEVGIYEFIRPFMFNASTRAFYGSSIFEICPDLCKEFFAFDEVMLKLFFGIPAIFVRKEIAIRQRILDSMLKWHEVMYAKYRGKPIDPLGDVAWEEDYGSKANRVKQLYYEERDISLKARAGCDLGFLFGLNSNSVPAAGWILMHLLDPKGDTTLLPRIMDELASARKENGDIDIPTLISLPLLQSVFHETLRLYVDAFVTRELFHDLVLPLENGKQVLFRKNTVLMAPSYISHHDVTVWHSPSANIWYAERFLRRDSETGKVFFSTTSTTAKGNGNNNAKAFPFGGGKTICPGRVFAKQEVMGAVAVFLMAFECKGLAYCEVDGRDRREFPGLKRAYGGAGVMGMDGDVRVRVRRRGRG